MSGIEERDHPPMRAVTRGQPCFACGKPDWCLTAADGSAVLCRRVADDCTKIVNAADGPMYLHHRDPAAAPDARPARVCRRSAARATPPARDWQAVAERYAAKLTTDRRDALAAALALPTTALTALPLIGWNGHAWTFPECDAAGTVVGISRRFLDGRKLAVKGSRRGLTLPAGWRERGGPLLIVEGPSDVLVATAAGLSCVGRPSCTGGTDDLAALLRHWPLARPIIVVAENDAMPDGRWPGRDGAVRLAAALAQALGRPVAWALPPNEAKDVRAWLIARPGEWAERGRDLSALLDDAAVEIEPDATGELPMTVAEPERPWPSPLPLSREPAAVPFPLDALPAGLATLTAEIADAMNCPPDFPALFMLAMIGGAVGNSIRVEVKPGYTASAALYAVAVGPPGSCKTPPLQLLREPFDAAEAGWLRGHRDRVTAWDAADEHARGPRPILRRCVVSDITAESLTLILAENPRGVVQIRDELAAVVAGLNQYKSGGNDRQFFLSAFSGDTIKNDRKSDREAGGAPRTVERPFLAVVGGIQPDVLASLRPDGRRGRPAADDGFIDRFLFAAPAPRPATGKTWLEVSADALAAWREAVGRLLGMPMGEGDGEPRPRVIPLSPSGRAAWQAFTGRLAVEMNAADFPPGLGGPWHKLREYCARLALVLATARWALGGGVDSLTVVDGCDVDAAARLVDYFKALVQRTRHMMDAEAGTADARRVLVWIERRPTTAVPFSKRDAFEGTKRKGDAASVVDGPLKLLAQHHYIRAVEPSDRTGPGRKPSDRYEPNPAIWHTDS